MSRRVAVCLEVMVCEDELRMDDPLLDEDKDEDKVKPLFTAGQGKNGCMGRLCGVRRAKIITTRHSRIGVMHMTPRMHITGCYALHGKHGSRTRETL